MSQSYNIALLRQTQFQEMHESYLREIAKGLQDVIDSKIEAKELEPLVAKAHTLYANLMMVNHQSSLTLALVLKKALSVLAKSEEKELSFVTVQKIAVKGLEFTNAFSRHMKDLINGVGDMAVVIWPYWVQLSQALGEPEPKIEELFDINPNFDDVVFTPKSASYLSDTVLRMLDVYQTDVLMKIEDRNTVGEMEKILQSALNVFNDLYSLRHRRSFQLYWLIMRARVAAGLMKPQKLLEDKDYWQALFRAAGIQIRKFQGDSKSRTLPFDVLYQALSPLLKPWPEKWKSGNPYLQELDARLGLSTFWKNVEEVKSEQGDGSQFYKRQDEIQAMLSNVQKAWANLAASNDKKRTKLCVLFLRELAPLMVNKGWIPGTLLNPVFDVLKFIAEQLTASIQETKELPPLSDIMIQEVASLLLLASEIVERKVRWSDELETRVRSQRYRVDIALSGNAEQLSNIPYVHWDSRWREKKIEDAIKKAFVLIQKPTEAFENVFHKLASQNKDEFSFTADYDLDNLRSHSNSLVHDADFLYRVLVLLRQPLAAALIKTIGDQLKLLLDAGAEDQKFAVLSTAMASFSRFVKGVIDDESEPKLLLRPGLVLLFGEEEYEKLMAAENNVVVHVPKTKEIEIDSSVEESLPELAEAQAEKPSQKLAVDYKKLLLTDGVSEVVKDEELVGVFLEETKDIFAENEKQRSILLMDESNQEAWESLRRGYHTLKGSARITGMFGLGEIAWWLEERINEGMGVGEVYSPALDQLSELTDEVLRNYYRQLSENNSVQVFGNKVWDKLQETEVSISGSEDIDFDENDPLAGLGFEEDSEAIALETEVVNNESSENNSDQNFANKVRENLQETGVSASDSENIDVDENDPLQGLGFEEDAVASDAELVNNAGPENEERDLLSSEQESSVIESTPVENEQQIQVDGLALDYAISEEEMELLNERGGLTDDFKNLLKFSRNSLQQSLDTAEMLGVLDASQVYLEMVAINQALIQLELSSPELLLQKLDELKNEGELSLDENPGNILKLALQEFCLMIEGYENTGHWNDFNVIDNLLGKKSEDADRLELIDLIVDTVNGSSNEEEEEEEEDGSDDAIFDELLQNITSGNKDSQVSEQEGKGAENDNVVEETQGALQPELSDSNQNVESDSEVQHEEAGISDESVETVLQTSDESTVDVVDSTLEEQVSVGERDLEENREEAVLVQEAPTSKSFWEEIESELLPVEQDVPGVSELVQENIEIEEPSVVEESVHQKPANSILDLVQPIAGEGASIDVGPERAGEQEESEDEEQGAVRDVKQLEGLIENLSLNTTVLQQLLKKVELEYPENSKEEKRMRGLLWKLSQESLSMMQLGLFALHQSTSMLNKLDYREEEE